MEIKGIIEELGKANLVVVPTDKTNSFRLIGVQQYTKEIFKHLDVCAKKIDRSVVVKVHEEAKARYERDGGSDFLARLIESWRSENYWASFFGNPETDASWGWMITGHHLAASFTVVDNNVAFTPLFLGAEP